MLWKLSAVAFLVLTIPFGFFLFTRPTDKNDTNSVIDESNNRTKLIIDTDAGADDAVAILLALSAKEKVDVIGITCVYGNTNETNVEINVLKILTTANRTDIPVYRGVRQPLLQSFVAGDYFGEDGLGDFDFGRPIEGAINSSTHAVTAMTELVKKYPGVISIVTLGPLTNVVLAASLDPNFTQNVKRFYVMGSTVNETNPGKDVEFNFGLDPESDVIFLKSSTRQKSLISPFDVVVKRSISKKWRKDVLGKLPSEMMKFLNKAEAVSIARQTEWLSADAITVATMIWPEIITSSFGARMFTIVCDDTFKGAVTVDYQSQIKNVEIVRDFNVSAFQDKLLDYLA